MDRPDNYPKHRRVPPLTHTHESSLHDRSTRFPLSNCVTPTKPDIQLRTFQDQLSPPIPRLLIKKINRPRTAYKTTARHLPQFSLARSKQPCCLCLLLF